MQTSGPPASKKQQTVVTVRNMLAEGKTQEAAKLLSDLPRKIADDPEILFLRGITMEQSERINEAVKAARQSLAAREHPDALLLLARCMRTQGHTEEALELCNKIDKLRPNLLPAKLLRGGVLEEAGRFDEATAIIEPLYTQAEASGNPIPPGIRFEWSKLLVQTKQHEEAVKLIDGTLEIPGLPEQAQSMQLHLRAKACDRMKDFEGAAESASRANDIGKVDFSPELYEEQVAALIDNWSRENMASFPLSSCDSEIPVFVAGMPRSGTSLIDQIIDAHPKAAGVGELNTIERFAVELSSAYNPDKPPAKRFGKYDSFRWTRAANAYIKQITEAAPPGAERIVNKALGNNKLVGLFARLFPKTRVIHAIRDPRDVAVSCFMGGFNNRLHAWTTQVDWVAHSWGQSMRMMDHWKQSLDIPILDVHYERLVADPESEMPRIIDFLGLEWDDACRDFYKSKRTVRTLSYDQVNRPLYTSSSGRHKNYESLLKGVDFPAYDPFAAR